MFRHMPLTLARAQVPRRRPAGPAGAAPVPRPVAARERQDEAARRTFQIWPVRGVTPMSSTNSDAAPAPERAVDDRLGRRAVRRSEGVDQVALAADEHPAEVGELSEALDSVVAADAAVADAAKGKRGQR